MNNEQIRFPAPLKKGDKIAVCSPAGKIKSNIVYDAVEVLRNQGWVVEIMPHALGENGNFSGTADERYADLKAAFSDPEFYVRAVDTVLFISWIGSTNFRWKTTLNG